MKRARLCINSHSKCIQDPKLTLGIGKACGGGRVLLRMVDLASFFAGQLFKEIILGWIILPQKQGCCICYRQCIRAPILKIQLPKIRLPNQC